MILTLDEHNAKVAALKAEYDAKLAIYKQLEFGEDVSAQRDAAFWAQTEAFNAYMDAADERYEATVAHFAETKGDA